MRLVLLLLIVVVATSAQAGPDAISSASSPHRDHHHHDTPCQYAWNPTFTPTTLLTSTTAQIAFVHAFLTSESAFHRPGISYNQATGLTYDGHRLDGVTGLPLAGTNANAMHLFTAPSKESLHIAMLTLALQGNAMAQTWVGPNARVTALDILTRKIDTYETFDSRFPGFGKFLPWVTVPWNGTAHDVNPVANFATSTPSLDNGQLAWACVAAGQVLREQGSTDLANRYDAWWKTMVAHARIMFLNDTLPAWRTVAAIRDIHATPHAGNYYELPCTAPPCYLDDPYEGELFTVLMDLFVTWPTQRQRNDIWIYKRAKLQRATWKTQTVQRGWWFSAHETWKYLLLPYDKVTVNWNVFVAGEQARTEASAENNLPGMHASVTAPLPRASPNAMPFAYFSGCGVEDLAFQPTDPRCKRVVTPYATFPLLLASQRHGLAWLSATLRGAGVQTVVGSCASHNVTAEDQVAPIVTWDSKVTTALAVVGGLQRIVQDVLVQEGVMQRFHDVVHQEWTRVFGNVTRHGDFAMPPEVSRGPPWPSCT